MDESALRRFCLSLPGSEEQPHFEMASFRVRGKVFVTVPPGGAHAHVFVDEPTATAAIDERVAGVEVLTWGRRSAGVRVDLAVAPDDVVAELVEDAWRRRAPKRLVAERDATR